MACSSVAPRATAFARAKVGGTSLLYIPVVTSTYLQCTPPHVVLGMRSNIVKNYGKNVNAYLEKKCCEKLSTLMGFVLKLSHS